MIAVPYTIIPACGTAPAMCTVKSNTIKDRGHTMSLTGLGALKQLCIEGIFKSGLFAMSDESHFSRYGCERCNWYNNRILSGMVYDVEGYLERGDIEKEKMIEARLCQKCINDLYSG
jgi:hypothetical protein